MPTKVSPKTIIVILLYALSHLLSARPEVSRQGYLVYISTYVDKQGEAKGESLDKIGGKAHFENGEYNIS